MSTITSYPLAWPDTLPRARSRTTSPFRTKFAKAKENVIASLRGFERDSGLRVGNPTLSTNIDLMGRLSPSDPGAAVWFVLDGQQMAFAIDRYVEVEGNVQAIHHVLEARRVELRHGGVAFVKQGFRSFVALPAPPSWWEILKVDRHASSDQIEAAYRALARQAHPDRGGSTERMAALNVARDQALAEIEKRD